ncbi:Gfo/Idh/MocA family oxidoreductase [Streptomyces sp. ACA25]|uniref:Gfo/Idh/MocA family protein n=1 Tax=Streptomyces sp. ACA25 TaxID=3022596 RepID=UPI002307C197|nr:Gfo/Idh/MocA family oxidoreductase [Streptomyces sp. ACA25]MDB1089990.1 Gfo/Idh/MocA family oxidoreductase [Streptomyces sp. ACA25]
MRFGLLGTGPWALRTHGPALVRHPDAELVGVWGRRPEAAAELAGQLGARVYADPDALFADCDAVALALPPDVQAPLAVRAAEAGCHLLLDKPVATTAQGARELAEAADRAGVASVVFFTLRFASVPAAWIEEQTAAGGWLTGRAEWFSPVFGGGDSPYAASPWRRQRGALWDIGPHALSLLLPPLGDVADLGEVRAARGPGDTVHLLLRHVSGASSTVTVSHTMPPQAASVTAELRGTAGIAALPDRETGDPATAFLGAVDALRAAAGGGPSHPCDVHFGRRVTDILVAVEEALDTHR